MCVFLVFCQGADEILYSGGSAGIAVCVAFGLCQGADEILHSGGSTGIAVGVAFGFCQCANQLLFHKRTGFIVAMGCNLFQTTVGNGVQRGVTAFCVDMDFRIREFANQITLLGVAVFGVSMCIHSTEGICFLSDCRKDQCVGCAEHNNTHHRSDYS